MSEIQEILQRHQDMKDGRRNWEVHWQDLAEVMLPRRADFTIETAVDGEKRMDRVYDGTPMLARRGLSSAIDGLLKPRTTKWFRIRADQKAINEVDEARLWFDEAERILFAALYDVRSKFIQRTGEVDDDLVTFGTGALFIGEGEAAHLMFQSMHLKDVFLVENHLGDVDGCHIVQHFTPRQAVQRYGRENLGEPIKDALNDPKKRTKKFEFIWVVGPRNDFDFRKRDNLNMPFSSKAIDVTGEKKVSESGFREFPFAFPRWDTASGELYGRSPGMTAWPDSSTLQAMGKTILVAGQKAVEPPLLVGSDSVIAAPRTFPGGITHFDTEVAAQLGGRPPIIPLNTGANIPLGREMQNDTRAQVEAAFFKNVLNLPVDAPSMTATEVLERKEEFIRTLAPVFGRLEADYIAKIVSRSFNILMRKGAFPELPQVLSGQEVDFQFASPVDQARRQVEAAGMARSLELLAPFIEFDPSIMDNFDGDEIARDAPEIFGIPQRWLRSRDIIQNMREQRAQQQQIQQVMENAGGLAQGVKAVGALDGSEAA